MIEHGQEESFGLGGQVRIAYLFLSNNKQIAKWDHIHSQTHFTNLQSGPMLQSDLMAVCQVTFVKCPSAFRSVWSLVRVAGIQVGGLCLSAQASPWNSGSECVAVARLGYLSDSQPITVKAFTHYFIGRLSYFNVIICTHTLWAWFPRLHSSLISFPYVVFNLFLLEKTIQPRRRQETYRPRGVTRGLHLSSNYIFVLCLFMLTPRAGHFAYVSTLSQSRCHPVMQAGKRQDGSRLKLLIIAVCQACHLNVKCSLETHVLRT